MTSFWLSLQLLYQIFKWIMSILESFRSSDDCIRYSGVQVWSVSKHLFLKRDISLEHINICRPGKYFILRELNRARQENTKAWFYYILNNSICFYPISDMYYNLPAEIYLFKVSNRNPRTMCEICLKSRIKKPERCCWRSSGRCLYC